MSWIKAKKPQLTPEQQAQLEADKVQQLRQLLDSEDGRTAADNLTRGGELTSADECTGNAYLRRWLTAREWDVQLACSCIIKHAGWRAHVMPHGFVDEAWIEGPLANETIFLQGTDSSGRAFAIVRVRDHVADKKAIKALRLFVCYAMNAMVALCDTQRNPRRRLVSMFDLTGATYANMDVAAMRMILGLLNVHFVETLDCLYFYNPPPVFASIWNSLKGLLPPATREKILIVQQTDLSELQAAVPPQVLPREYGGDAEVITLQQAVRQFRLPPHPHLPELRAAAAAAAAAAGGGTSAVSVAGEAPSSDEEEEEDIFHDALEEFECAAAAAASGCNGSGT